jgi:hypothetical protein
VNGFDHFLAEVVDRFHIGRFEGQLARFGTLANQTKWVVAW